jgi:hypothetical protein
MSNQPRWVVSRNCPKRDELVIVTLDGNNDAYVWFKSAGSYGTATNITSTAPSNAARVISAAYEQNSGHLLVSYDSSTAAATCYRTASSASISAQSTISGFATTAACHTTCLYAQPKSDTILLLGADSQSKLWACFWNGSSWGTATQLTTTLNQYDTQDFSAVFLASGDAVVCFGTSGSNAPSVRTYSGGSWGAATTLTAGTTKMNILKMAIDSTGSKIVLAGVGADSSLIRYHYTSGTWSGQTVAATAIGTSTARLFDVAWTPDNAHCLLAYAKGTNNVFARTFDGTTWSAEVTGPTLTAGSNTQVVTLTPGSSGKQIFVHAANAGLGLWSMIWDGASLGTATQLETSLGGVSGNEPFAVSDMSKKFQILSWENVDPAP